MLVSRSLAVLQIEPPPYLDLNITGHELTTLTVTGNLYECQNFCDAYLSCEGIEFDETTNINNCIILRKGFSPVEPLQVEEKMIFVTRHVNLFTFFEGFHGDKRYLIESFLESLTLMNVHHFVKHMLNVVKLSTSNKYVSYIIKNLFLLLHTTVGVRVTCIFLMKALSISKRISLNLLTICALVQMLCGII